MHIMFWGFLTASCMGEDCMCESKIICQCKLLQCAHIDINYTDRGCMTCGEKQEMHYHRYLNLSEYFYVNF